MFTGTENFSLDELTFSETAERRGIDNTPSAAIIENLGVLAAGLEEIRALLGNRPIFVTSGYRSPAVNAAVGGALGSAHIQGFAADFVCRKFGSPKKVAEAIRDFESVLDWDQLILEYNRWVHISFAPAMRGEALTKTFAAGYLQGIV